MTLGRNEKEANELQKAVLSELSFYAYKSLLNVGCGRGGLLALIPRRKGLFLAGFDHREEHLGYARQKDDGRVDFHCGKIPELPWDDNHFDAVLCTDSHHVSLSPLEGFEEFFRVLKPGGRLILTAPWWPSPLRQIINFFRSLRSKPHVPIYSEPEYVTMLQQCGFDNVKWRLAQKHICIVVAQSIKSR